MSSVHVRRKHLRVALNLETCDNRLVPSTTIDLTTRGSEGVANSAIFQQCDPQPTGTGVIQSFVRVQNNGVEQGYNTDARPLQLDENNSPQFTRSLTLGAVPIVTLNNVRYREFLLDINQKSSSPLLSLDELRLYVAGTNTLNNYDATAQTLGGLPAVYDLDADGNVTVKLNYRLNPGSGGGDMVALIPNSAFAGQSDSAFVYLYSKFGATFGANAGFEEWAVRKLPASSPTSSLSGYVYLDGDGNGVRDSWETGFAGIAMQLQGVNDRGESVFLSTTTNADGYYAFTNLRPGVYSIIEVDQPVSSLDGFGVLDSYNSIGTLGGTAQEFDAASLAPDGILSITLGLGDNGLEYNFGKVEDRPD
jgi:hypothetical protein